MVRARDLKLMPPTFRRYRTLLGLLVVWLFVVQPLRSLGLGPIIPAAFSLVLIAGMVTLHGTPLVRALGAITAAVAVVAAWIGVFDPAPWVRVLQLAAGALFLGTVAANVLRELAFARTVSTDLLLGSACGYLLLGATWALLLAIVGLVQPGAFALPGLAATTGPADPATISAMIYFSFVTLTTLGYGDILPLTVTARSLVVLEAITGQLFLALIVARLVALHLAGADRD